MSKDYIVDGQTYSFPNDYTDEKAQEILTQQGIIKVANPKTTPPPALPWEQQVNQMAPAGLTGPPISTGQQIVNRLPANVLEHLQDLVPNGPTGNPTLGGPQEINPLTGKPLTIPPLENPLATLFGGLKSIGHKITNPEEDPIGTAAIPATLLQGIFRGGSKIAGKFSEAKAVAANKKSLEELLSAERSKANEASRTIANTKLELSKTDLPLKSEKLSTTLNEARHAKALSQTQIRDLEQQLAALPAKDPRRAALVAAIAKAAGIGGAGYTGWQLLKSLGITD